MVGSTAAGGRCGGPGQLALTPLARLRRCCGQGAAPPECALSAAASCVPDPAAGGLAAAQPEEAPCPSGGEANFTAADCPNGSCYAGEPNGCGSRSVRVIAAEIVPERWPAGVDFTEACNTHDTCYFTLGSDKAQCDQAFLDALLAECDRAVR